MISRDEIADLMRVFLPDGTNEARLVDQVDGTISKVVELGFLRRLKPAEQQRPRNRQRALDVLKSAKKPLIILGKGAAYAQADAEIRALVEKTGIPYLPMSMAKGLLPDTHEQSAAADGPTDGC